MVRTFWTVIVHQLYISINRKSLSIGWKPTVYRFLVCTIREQTKFALLLIYSQVKRGRNCLQGVAYGHQHLKCAKYGPKEVITCWKICKVQPKGLWDDFQSNPCHYDDKCTALNVKNKTILSSTLHFHSACAKPKWPL